MVNFSDRFFQTFEKRRFEKVLTLSEMRIYEEELYKTLMDCIFHHQNIIKLKNAINEFFGPVIVIRFLMSTMMLCFNIYSTSKVSVTLSCYQNSVCPMKTLL